MPVEGKPLFRATVTGQLSVAGAHAGINAGHRAALCLQVAYGGLKPDFAGLVHSNEAELQYWDERSSRKIDVAGTSHIIIRHVGSPKIHLAFVSDTGAYRPDRLGRRAESCPHAPFFKSRHPQSELHSRPRCACA